MPEYNAGDARLRIVPDASKFKEDLETKLKTIRTTYNVIVNVELAAAQARADMQRWRAEQSAIAVNQRVNPQFTRANAEMAAWRAEQRTNGVTVPIKADTDPARRAARAVVADMGASFGKLLGATFDVGKVMGLTSLVASMPAAVNAVASLTAAVTQLSGAALVVPGAFATAGASIGTLVVGLSGIADAYSAVSAASDESSTGQVERARAATSATQSLRNAVVDEAQAQKDVATARKDALQQLQDLNLELRGGQISEAQAVNDAAKARRDLAKGGFKDALDRRDAELRVASADQRVIDAHNRLIDTANKKADADAKGIDNADVVVAANERAVRSHQAVASAQQAVTDANTTSVGAADKAAEAMAKLSPQAAAFVTTLVGLKPKWEDLKRTVSGNLFEGASASFTGFVDSVLPNLQTGMGSIATEWNSNIKTLLSSLGSDNSKGLLDRILGNTAQAQKNFDAAIDPLVRGIGTLVAAGSDAIPRLATAIGNVAERFATFIEAADKDGRLKGWIDAGLDGLTNLGNILLNLGDSFASISKALGGPGLLANLEKVTSKWAAFLSSGEGQNTLKRIFDEGRAAWELLKPILENLPGIFEGVFGAAVAAANVFLPVLQVVTDLLSGNPELVTAIATAFITWKTIKPAIDGVKGAMELLVGGLLNVSTGFQPIKDKSDEAMKATAKSFDEAGGDSSKGVGKFASKVSWLSAAGGPLVMLATVGLGFVASFVAAHNQKMDDAVTHAEALNRKEKELLETLNQVSGAITAQSRLKITDQLTDQALPPAPLSDIDTPLTDAGRAAQNLGIDPTDVVSAVAGDAALKQQITDKLVATLVKDPKLQETAGRLVTPSGDKLQGADADDATRLLALATLGDDAALKQLVDKYRTPGAALPGGRSGGSPNVTGPPRALSRQTVDNMTGGLTDAGRQAALTGRGLNQSADALAGAQSQVASTNTTAFGHPELTPQAQNIFAAYQPSTVSTHDGQNYEVKLNKPLTPDEVAALNVNGNSVYQGTAPDTAWYLKISPDNNATDIIPGYASGGPAGAGLAVLHPNEFVLSAKAAKYPMGLKNALNEGTLPLNGLPHFETGGPYKPQGPAPTDPIAPAPATGGIPSIFSDIITGIQAPINNAISIAQQAGAAGGGGGGEGGGGPTGGGGLGGLGGGLFTGGPGIPSWAGAPAAGGPGIGSGPLSDAHGQRMADMGTGLTKAPGDVGYSLSQIPSNRPPEVVPVPRPPTDYTVATPTPTPTPAASTPAPAASTPTPAAAATPGPDVSTGIGTGAPPGPPVPTNDPAAAAPDYSNPYLTDDGTVPEPDLLHKWLWWLPRDDSPIDANAIVENMPDKIKPFNIARQFGEIMLGGVLGFFGLQDSILSPSNELNQDAQSTFGFFANKFGGGSGTGGDSSSEALPAGVKVDADGKPFAVDGPAAQNPLSKVPGAFGDSPPTISGKVAAGLGNPTLYATSGPDAYKVPNWANQLAAEFGLKASTYSDGDSLHQAGYAFDFNPSGGPGDPEGAAKMDRFADYVAKNLGGQTLQLIHRDASTGQEWRVAGGHKVGPGTVAPSYFDANMAGHVDHVHWATDIAPILAEPGDPNAALSGLPTSGQNAILHPQSGPVGGSAGRGSVVAAGGLKSKAYQIYIAAGMPPGEWDEFDKLIAKESGWQPTAQNPTSTAYGLGQFLDDTWASVGGAKTSDPLQQLPLIFAYLKARPDYHGSPAAAWSLWNQREPHWYSRGGGVDTVPAMLTPGEHVLTTGDVKAMGGQRGVYDFRQRLHLAEGGAAVAMPMAMPVVPPIKPTPIVRPPDANIKIAPSVPRPAPPRPVPVAPAAPAAPRTPTGPAPGGPAAGPAQGPQNAPPTGAPPGAPAPPTGMPAPELNAPPGEPMPDSGPDPTAPAPESYDHNLAAINTGIDSGAQAIGQAVSTAIGIAGSSGMTPGVGAIGPYVAGLIQQGGKIAKNVVNIGSSFLVGNVTPGTQDNAYGDRLAPEQKTPQSAELDGGRQYVFNGIDSRNVVDEIRLKDRQDQQAVLARW
jgi:hypothetical protein